jgi:DNA-binding MarR family transcriptional regulator
MERDQLITRSPDPTDRRSALIHLTPHAKTLIGHVMTIGRDVGQWALQDFTDAQREALLDHLATLNDRLATAREEP